MGFEFVFVCWLFGCLGLVLCLLSKTPPVRAGFYNIYQTPNVYPRVITLALIPTLPYRERAYFLANLLIFLVCNMIRHERHGVSDLRVHLVCVTKYRRKVLTSEGLALIKESFEAVAKKMNFQILEFNGESNHVHAAIEYPPKLSISQIVNHLKGVSSRMCGKAGYQKPHQTALWSPSDFVTSVGGAPLEILKQHIQNQKSP